MVILTAQEANNMEDEQNQENTPKEQCEHTIDLGDGMKVLLTISKKLTPLELDALTAKAKHLSKLNTHPIYKERDTRYTEKIKWTEKETQWFRDQINNPQLTTHDVRSLSKAKFPHQTRKRIEHKINNETSRWAERKRKEGVGEQ